ncbi:hypothetical protein D2C76_02115 [Helicobacter pylori]|nr:hypothetical protein [Helicobacter pylori]QEF38676.1 hypothetical protein D2C76_02115 [Helicobacter pylori]
MKRSHLENALSYALENSETAYNEMFMECDKQFILETWLNDFDLTNDYNEAMHLVFSIKDKPDGEIMQGLLPKTNALKPLAFSYGDTRRNAFRR